MSLILNIEFCWQAVYSKTNVVKELLIIAFCYVYFTFGKTEL